MVQQRKHRSNGPQYTLSYRLSGIVGADAEQTQVAIVKQSLSNFESGLRASGRSGKDDRIKLLAEFKLLNSKLFKRGDHAKRSYFVRRTQGHLVNSFTAVL